MIAIGAVSFGAASCEALSIAAISAVHAVNGDEENVVSGRTMICALASPASAVIGSAASTAAEQLCNLRNEAAPEAIAMLLSAIGRQMARLVSRPGNAGSGRTLIVELRVRCGKVVGGQDGDTYRTEREGGGTLAAMLRKLRAVVASVVKLRAVRVARMRELRGTVRIGPVTVRVVRVEAVGAEFSGAVRAGVQVCGAKEFVASGTSASRRRITYGAAARVSGNVCRSRKMADDRQQISRCRAGTGSRKGGIGA
jgi:hypothetical protein